MRVRAIKHSILSMAITAIVILPICWLNAWATEVDVQEPLGPYVSVPVDADSLDLNWTVASPTTGATFAITGKEFLLVRNRDYSSDTATATFTINTTPLNNRTAHITDYVLSASEVACFHFGAVAGLGYLESGQYIASVTPSSATALIFAVIRY